jgi:hypothetical protein
LYIYGLISGSKFDFLLKIRTMKAPFAFLSLLFIITVSSFTQILPEYIPCNILPNFNHTFPISETRTTTNPLGFDLRLNMTVNCNYNANITPWIDKNFPVRRIL